jgi:glycosyltransferase involved in cell wall biosynthesis
MVYEIYKLFSWNSRGDRVLLTRMFKSPAFRGLVTISTPLRDILAEETGLDPARILVAHDAARASEVDKPEQLGPSGRLQVGYVGAFYPGRGIELILEIAALLPEMDFHFIGGAARDLAQWGGKDPGLSNVSFHGFLPPARAAALRAGCDVLLAPYQRKTLIKDGWDTTRWMSPLKIFEYMSAGKPILCSDLPVLREVMVEERNALLLPPDDSTAWVAALRRLRADPAYAHALGERAYRDFKANHTWAQRARRIMDFAGVT